MGWLKAPLVTLGLAILPLAPARAEIQPPFVLGSTHAAAGSATLTFSTNKDCPPSGMVFVAVSEFGSDIDHTSVADDAGNTYGTAGSEFTAGGIMRGEGWINNSNGFHGVATPSGTTFTVTYGSSSVDEAAIAVCVIGTREGPQHPSSTDSLGPEGIAGLQAAGTSNNPAISSPHSPLSNYGSIVFVLTLIDGGASDSWTEDANFTTLKSVTNINATRLAYVVVDVNTPPGFDGTTPPPYSATNSVSRAWAANYIPYIAGTCGLASSGGGPC